MRTLSRRELNRALLARRVLLVRGTLPLPWALEQLAGIQAQQAPSMYVGLWSRLEGVGARHVNLVKRNLAPTRLMVEWCGIFKIER